MPKPKGNSQITNIGIVGGNTFCKEVLEKTTFSFRKDDVNARILIIADPDPESPGLKAARDLGLKTVSDYHALYDPDYQIDLIIHLAPSEEIFEDILKTKPHHIRLLSYPAFNLFWRAIRVEEEKLRARTEEMETILNGIQEFILVITPERTILEANEVFLRKMGYTREEVIGRKCHEIFRKVNQPCDDGNSICPINQVIRDRRPHHQVRTRMDHNGEPRYIEVSIYPIWDSAGKISHFIEVSRDITDRKKEEEEMTRRLEQMVEDRTRELEETHAKLVHQDKMASLGKLSASVVHEINNPIAGILNLILLIKRLIDEGPVSQKDLDKFSQYLNLMDTETRRVSRIVSNLLAFSCQSNLVLNDMDINRLIEKTLFLNSNLLKINNIRVKKRFTAQLPRFMGSEDQLQQVFMNMISNAAEAMEGSGGGTLTIETEHLAGERKLMVRFRDSGPGIPRENLSRLFEPFFTTKKKGKGVGLGLSVAYGIIEEHGGAIRVESRPSQGAVFEIEVPLDPPSRMREPQQGSLDEGKAADS
ncbi:MAG: PAS domain-containing protein [Deltaproteobacteria bacterium]|nr:PAS domain-containing protein [Deltaproteobacteria bacterium]